MYNEEAAFNTTTGQLIPPMQTTSRRKNGRVAIADLQNGITRCAFTFLNTFMKITTFILSCYSGQNKNNY